MDDKPVKVLLIEDNREYAELMQKVLPIACETPFEVVYADRLEAGLDLLENQSIDVVLLDLSLPDSRGFETFTKVQAIAQDVPIVLLSGTDDERMAVEAVRQGAQDYLVKGRAEGDLLVRSVRYAIERKSVEKALRQRNRELALLHRTILAFSSTLDLDEVLVTVLEEVRSLLDVIAASIWLIDPDTGELVCQESMGPQRDRVRGWRLPSGQGLGWHVIETGESLIVADTQSDQRYFSGVDEETGLWLRSVLTAPLQAKEEIIGVLQVVDAEVDSFRPTDLALVEPLAASAAAAIENARLYEASRQTERALRASEQKFRGIVQQASDGIMLSDESGRIIVWNAAQEQITGLPRADVLGRSVWEVQFQLAPEERATPHNQQRIKADVLEFLETGRAPWLNQLMEQTFQHPDGTQRVIQAVVFPVQTETGHILGSVSRDITRQRQVEAALGREQEKAQQYLDIVEVILVALDAGGNIELINRKGCRALGYREEELLGKDWFATCLPEDGRDEAKATFAQVVRGEATLARAYEGLIVTKSGEERVVAWHNTVLRDADDEICGILSSGEDVTEQKRAESALRESEERFSKAFWVGPQPLIISRLSDGMIIEANEACHQALGYNREELMGHTAVELGLISAEDQQRSKEMLQEHGSLRNVEITFYTKSGESRVGLFSEDVIELGGETCIIQVIYDITERKHAEALLRIQRDLGLALGSIDNLQQALSCLLETALEIEGIDCGGVYLVDEQSGDLDLIVHRGFTPAFVECVSHYPVDSPQSRLVKAGEPSYQSYAEVFPEDKPEACQDEGLRAIAVVPVVHEGQVIAALNLSSHVRDEMPVSTCNALEAIAAQIGGTIARIRAEEAVRDSEEMYKAIAETSPDAVMTTDLEGRITFASRRTLEVHGLDSVEEALGRHATTFIIPAEHDKAAAGFERTLKEGAVRNLEYTLLRKDGSTFPADLSAALLRSATGEPKGFIAITRDISERREAEERLRRRNEELAALNAIATAAGHVLGLEEMLITVLEESMEALQVEGGLIYLFDATCGTFSPVADHGFSPAVLAELTGFRVGEGLSGRAAATGEPVFAPNLADDPRNISSAAVREGWRSLVCVPLLAKEETVGVMTLVSRAENRFSVERTDMLQALGHQLGVAIENSRLAEEAAEIEVIQELNRLRSELIANVSHEVRTPLGLIKVFCTTLLRDDVALDRETQREFLQDIDQETDRLEKIVDDLLDLSRIESDRLQLVRQSTDVNQLVRRVAEAMAVQVSHRHHLVYDLPSEPLMANIDASRIEQVVRNLLDNGIKYSPSGGTITLGGCGDDNQLLFWVKDEGVGISSDDLERVFERFYRIEDDSTQHVRGAGLGLAVCRGIVTAHGGRIWVESEVGHGSTFYFTLAPAG